MRAKEFITEIKKLPSTVRSAGVKGRTYKNMDSFYDLYRMGMSMANQPGNKTHPTGPSGDSPTIWAYTDAEEDIIKSAEKNQKLSSKIIVGRSSDELADTNTKSPTANKKKNKYGV